MSETQTHALGSRQEKRAFYRRALRITLPIALQNLLDAAVNSADVIMLSFVSQSALAASSLAGQIAFILGNLTYGLSSGAAVLSAQYFGKGDKRAVERVMGIALRVGVLVSLLFGLAAMLAPEAVMRIFTDDASLITDGVLYLRTVSPSYVLGAFASIYLAVMRSVGRVKMSAAIHCSAVIMNVVLNACFIFGFGPFPELGIVGVALATSITRLAEVAICLMDNARGPIIRMRVKDLISRGGELMRDFIKFSVPAAANDIIWGLAFSVYSIILGHLSSDIVAANSVATVVRNLSASFCFGAASSAAIILGNTMGENRLEEARVYASRFMKIAFWSALAGGALILICRPVILDFMHLYVTVTDVVKHELNLMLYINAYYIMGMSLNTMMVCGIFRSGGDVKFGLVGDTIAMWIYAVPMGLFCAFLLKLPEMWVYFILCLDEFVKMPAFWIHYRRKKWLRNITREQTEA